MRQSYLLGRRRDSRFERLVSLAPSATESLIYLGLASKIVGVTRQCGFPEVAGREIVGSFVRPDLEKVRRLEPDLVLAMGHVHGGILEGLAEEVAPVLVIVTRDLQGILQGMDCMASLAGDGAYARSLVDALKARLLSVRQRVASYPPVRVFRLMHEDPIRTPTSSCHQWDAIRLAGGDPMPLEIDEPYTSVTVDKIVDFAPQAIVSCGRNAGDEPKPRCLNCRKEKPLCQRVVDEIAGWEGWKETAAARSGRILSMPCHLLCRPGPRLVDGIERMAEFLHPRCDRG